MIVASNCLVLALAVLVGVSQRPRDRPDENHPEFGINTDDGSGRFMVLKRTGNERDRPAYITVFEYLGKGRSLRKLYETRLLNKYMPLAAMISRDGRFYVTMDEWTSSGTSPVTLVIYDLARKEQTAYAGKDFLSERVIKSLPRHGFVPGYKWHGIDYNFNETSTKLYPTLPENCKKHDVPFIVIDLPTRTVRVEPIPKAPIKDIVPIVSQRWGWIESKETVKTKAIVLPKRIRWRGPGEPDRHFELSPDGNEYRPVVRDGKRGRNSFPDTLRASKDERGRTKGDAALFLTPDAHRTGRAAGGGVGVREAGRSDVQRGGAVHEHFAVRGPRRHRSRRDDDLGL